MRKAYLNSPVEETEVQQLRATIRYMRWFYVFLVVTLLAQMWLTTRYRRVAEEWRQQTDQAVATSSQALEAVQRWSEVFSNLDQSVLEPCRQKLNERR